MQKQDEVKYKILTICFKIQSISQKYHNKIIQFDITTYELNMHAAYTLNGYARRKCRIATYILEQ